MVYLETGKMSWSSTYGMGRYIQELLRTNVYDYVICSYSQKEYVPIIKSKIIALDDSQYKKKLSTFIQNMKEGDVIHFPGNTIVVDNIPTRVKVVYTIHDLTPLLFYKHKKQNGNFFSDGTPLSTYEWKENVLYALIRADCILTVSENTKKDIVKYFDIQQEKIVSIYHGVDERFVRYSSELIEEKKRKYGLKNKRIIMGIMGAKHKNLIRLILAYYLLILKDRSKEYCLILVGDVIPKIDIFTKLLQKRRKVFLTGRVSDEELVWCYNLSDYFVFVSLYEGFGFPLLEAYACGTRVITSNTSSLGELSGGYAQQVNPKKIGQIENAMKTKVHYDEEFIVKQVNYAKSFKWTTFREKHKRVIESVLKS